MVLYVGVGQCGIQIVENFVQNEINVNRDSNSYFVSSSNKFRSILVDSESKVINNLKSKSLYRQQWRDENMFYTFNGRGSNWCYGYFGSNSKEQEQFINVLLKEVEREDNYTGCVFIHSLAGGTGSGMGCKLVELTRDELGLHQILSCGVLASDCGGDNPLQNYNTMLALSALHRCTDGQILMHNDLLCKQLSNDNVTMADVNNLISSQLSCMLTPSRSIYPWLTPKYTSIRVNIELNEYLRNLCSIPQLHITQLVSSQYSRWSLGQFENDFPYWFSIILALVQWISNLRNVQLSSQVPERSKIKATNQQLPQPDWMKIGLSCLRQLNYITNGNPVKTSVLGSITSYRGCSKINDGDHLVSLPKLQKGLANQLHYPTESQSDWLNANDVWIDDNPNDIPRICLSMNSNAIVPYLKGVIKACQLKYNHGAYLHWYFKHGGTKELFQQSFEEVNSIIDSYSMML